MMFRFIHTGDIHLDSPLKGLAGQQGAAADRIRSATRAAFANLVDYAIEEAVSFFIIAGDLYDGDWRDYQTGLFFAAQMGRLSKAGIPVFLLYGNHDAESQINKRLALPDHVRAFSFRKPETFELKDLRVALHGQSFRQRDITENLVPVYPAPVEGAFNIGVLHTGLGGMEGHANYAPCSLDDLVNKGYDYWALAHVHRGAILHRHPHVVFCGNLQGRHMRETGAKSASLVTVEDGQVADIAPVEVDVVRWMHVAVPVDDISSAGEVIDRLTQVIEESVNNAAGRLIACRIELTGRTGLHDYLLSSRKQLDAEARAAALTFGDEAAWIERLVISTEAAAGRRAGDGGNAPDDFAAILGEAANDPALVSQFETELGELVRKLPHDIRADADDGMLRAAVSGDYSGLVSEASRYLKARLAAEGE